MRLLRLRLFALSLLVLVSYGTSVSAVSLAAAFDAATPAAPTGMVGGGHAMCAHGAADHSHCPMMRNGSCPMHHGAEADSTTRSHSEPCWRPPCGGGATVLVALSPSTLGVPPAERRQQSPSGSGWVLPFAIASSLSLGHHPPSPPPRA